ncbi:MAG: molybdenum ABC transporter ATP-binding protein [Rhodospirillales bacterium]
MLEIKVRLRQGDFLLDAELTADSGITVLFGRSGSGKTTLIDMLAGLRQPESGIIRMGDQVVFDSTARVNIAPERRAVGYVFQDARLFPHLNVRDNLAYGLKRARNRPQGYDLGEIVELLELGPLLNRRPRSLSGGEAQRVSIGRALLRQPEALLLDEPLSSLDVSSRAQLVPFIARIGATFGKPVVMVSHSIEEVVRLGDHMALMSEGRVIETGPVGEIMSRIDLGPLTGRHEAGAVIDAVVEGHDATYGLSRLSFGPDRSFQVPAVDLRVGEPLRIRVRSRDVGLSLTRPRDSSFLNVLPGRVHAIADEAVDSQVDVQLDVGVLMIARVTKKSCDAMGLVPGKEIFALVKSVAIDSRSLGRHGEKTETGQKFPA